MLRTVYHVLGFVKTDEVTVSTSVKAPPPPPGVSIVKPVDWPSEAEVNKPASFSVTAKMTGETTNPGFRVVLVSGPGSIVISAAGRTVTINPGGHADFMFTGTYAKDQTITLSGTVTFSKEGSYTIRIEVGYFT